MTKPITDNFRATDLTEYKYYRKLIGSQRLTAELLGVDHKTLHRRESGESPLTIESGLAMKALAQELGYEVEWSEC